MLGEPAVELVPFLILEHVCLLVSQDVAVDQVGNFNVLQVSDLTQITLRSKLLSQIRGSVVVLRDRIHRELENLINLIRLIKLIACL